jgi:hypothetical protein
MEPVAGREPDAAVERQHPCRVYDPGRIGDLHDVPELVAQQGDARVGRGIGVDGHMQESVPARDGHQLCRRCGSSFEPPSLEVDDQIGFIEPFQQRPERRRAIASPTQCRLEHVVVGAKPRRAAGTGTDVCAGDHREGDGQQRGQRAREPR